MSAGQVSSGRTDSTASWLDPESNQTSRMFISRSNSAPPHDGQANPAARLLESAARTRRRRRRARTPPRLSISSAVEIASPHACSRTPESARPTRAGARCTNRAGSRPCCGSDRVPTGIHSHVDGVERRVERRGERRRLAIQAMNHCDVARKITGLWQRQQCGYWWRTSRRCHSRPRLERRLDLRVGVEHA